MTNFRSVACVAVFAIALTGCSSETKKTFGLEANPPDAFAVGTQAPLSLPPELGQLQPPNPGEPRPQQVNAAQAGANVISAANAITPPPSAASPGEEALLTQAGPTPPPGIRAEVNQQALIASKPPGFVCQPDRQRPGPGADRQCQCRRTPPAGKRSPGPARHQRFHPAGQQRKPRFLPADIQRFLESKSLFGRETRA